MERASTFFTFSTFFCVLVIASGVELVDDNVTYIHLGRTYKEQDGYTDINSETDQNYASDTGFNAGMMTGLFNLSQLFMDVILKEIDVNDFISVNEQHEIEINDDVVSHIEKFTGLLTFLAFIVAFLVLFPLCGLIFSCCRCCGNCGARKRTRNKESDHCGKIWKGGLLIVLIVGLLFCAVSAFGSSELLIDGVKKFPRNAGNSIKDVEKFFDNTASQMNTLLTKNFDEFREKITEQVTGVKDNLKTQIDDLNLDSVEKFIGGVNDISTDIDTISDKLSTFQTSTDNLKTGLKEFKGCVEEKCNLINPKPSFCSINVEFEINVPDITGIKTEIENVDFSSVEDAINKFNEFKGNIDEKVNEYMQQVDDQFNTAQTTINDNLETVMETINDLKSFTGDKTDSIIDDAENNINDYIDYVHAGVAFFSCILIIITLVLTLGLIWGTFGKVPTETNKGCGTKVGGSKFMICGVGLMFAFAFFFSLMALILSATGILTQRLVCDQLKTIENSKLVNLLDQAVNLSDFTTATFGSILRGCQKNDGVYLTFKLQDKFDLDKIDEEFDVEAMMDNVQEQINGLIPDASTIMPDDLEIKLKTFATTADGIDFEINDLGITSLVESLTSAQTDMKEHDEFEDCLDILSPILETEIPALEESIKDLKADLDKTQEDLKLGSDKTSVAVDLLIEDTKKIGEDVTKIRPIINDFIEQTKKKVTEYINRIMDSVKTTIGKCQPVYNALQNILVSTCDKITTPITGFWFSLFWALALFIPTIFVSVALASLYQKLKTSLHVYDGNDRKKGKGKKNRGPDDYYNAYNNNGYEFDGFESDQSMGQRYNEPYSRNNGYEYDNRYGYENNRYDDPAPNFRYDYDARTRF